MATSELTIERANSADLAAIVEIYNHYIEHSHATFDTEAFSVDERVAWFASFDRDSRQCLVARQHDKTIGFACSGVFKPKPAWDSTVEVSVYLAPEAAGRGVGTALYSELIPRLDAAGVHRAAAIVALPNTGSITLHQRFGFETMGVISEGGFKLGQYWDVAYLVRNRNPAGGR